MPLPEGFTLEKQSPISLPEGFKLEQPAQGGFNLPAGFTIEKPEPRPEDQSVFRQVADVPLQFGKGAVEGVRMVTDALGADNPVSKTLRGVEDYVGSLLSAQSKKDAKEIARIMKDAEDKGVGDQVLAGVKAFSVAPVDTMSRVFGNAMPAVAGGLATYLLRGGALAATAVGAGTGATMGAGSVKGTIYDGVKEALKDTGMSPEQIEKRAALAQAYDGKNLDLILAGTAIGGLSAATGLEGVFARQAAQRIVGKGTGNILQREAVEAATKKATETAAKRGIGRNAAVTGATEAGTEFGQEAQEKIAENIALQREGFNVPTFRGAVGAGTMGALSASGLGAYAGGREGQRARREIEFDKSVEGKAIRDIDALITQEEKKQRVDELKQVQNPTRQEQSELAALQASLGPLADTTQQEQAPPPMVDELTSLKQQLDALTKKMESEEQRFGEPFEETIDDYMNVKERVTNLSRQTETEAEREMREAEEYRNAPPVEDQVYEGPEPPDFNAPAPAPAAVETDEQREARYAADIAEEDKRNAAQDAKRANALTVARASFDSALDQVNSSDYNGDLNAAFESYRQNMYDTLGEQGEKEGWVGDAASREFDRLVEEHKAQQPSAQEVVQEEPVVETAAAPAELDTPATLQKLEDEGIFYRYADAVRALEQGDEIYAVDTDDVFRIASATKSLQRLTTPEQIREAANSKLELVGLETEAGNTARANKIMDDVRALETQQQGLLGKSGRMPAKGTTKRKFWDDLTDKISNKKKEWAELTRGEKPGGALFAEDDNVVDMTARRELQIEEEETQEITTAMAEMRRRDDLQTLAEVIYPFLMRLAQSVDKARLLEQVPGNFTGIQTWQISSALRKYDDLAREAYFGVNGDTTTTGSPFRGPNELPLSSVSVQNAKFILANDGAEIESVVKQYLEDAVKFRDGLNNRSPREKKTKLAMNAILNNVVPITSAKFSGPASTNVNSLHPSVIAAIENNDINGALRAMAQNTSGFTRELAARLAELNLPTNIVFGQQRALFRKEIDRQTAQQQVRLFAYIRQMHPDLFDKYFKNYDRAENLEQVMEGLREFDKPKYNKAAIEGEFRSVLKVFGELVPNMDAPGFFLPAFDVINLNPHPYFGTANRTVLHEIVHAATEYALRSTEGLSDRQIEAVAELNAMFKYARENIPTNEYGFKNIYEFVAEVMTNKGFQDKLKTLSYKSQKASVWSRIVQAIGRILGFDNLAGAAAIEINEILSPKRRQATIPLGPLFAPKGPRNRAEGPISTPGTWRIAERDAVTLKERISRLFTSGPTKENAITDLKDVIWDVTGDTARKVVLPFLQLRQMKDMVRTKFPQLEGYVNVVEQMTSFRGNKISGPVNGDVNKSPEGITKRWAKAQAAKPAQSMLMGRLMIEVTSRGVEVDPMGPKYDPSKVNKALADAWNILTPEFKEIYRDARNFYAQSVKDMVQAMKDKTIGLPAAERAKLLKEIDLQFGPDKLVTPYFPLRRFGDYWFQVGEGDFKEFYMFESAGERRRALNERRRELQNGNKQQKKLADTLFAGKGISEVYTHNANTTTVLGNVNKLVDQLTTADPVKLKGEIKDSINQLVYLLLPQQSMRKMFINRRSVQGASSDMLRVFAMTSVHSAYQQARFKFAEPLLATVTQADKYVDELPVEQQIVYRDFVREMDARTKTVLGVEDKSAWARTVGRLTETTFFFMLTAPASAMLNIIGMHAITMPYIGGKYGYAATNATMLKNIGRYMGTAPKRTFGPITQGALAEVEFPSLTESKDLTPLERRFADTFIQNGQLNISATHDIFGMSEEPSAMYTGRTSKIKQGLAAMFHQAERLNREVTLMSVAQLAYDKYKGAPKKDIRGVIERDANGKPVTYSDEEAFNLAIDEANDIAGLTLGDFTRQMKGRVFTVPGMNLLLQFKQYAITTTYVLLRNLYLSVGAPFTKSEVDQFRAELQKNNDLTPEQIEQKISEMEAQRKEMYKEGRRRLAGILGMAFLYGGVTAMPFFSMLGPLVRMFNDDDDDDEFRNWQNDFYNGMEDAFGSAVSKMFLNAGGDPQKAAEADSVGRAIAHTITRGAGSTISGASIADRVSLDLKNLWFREGKFSPDARESLKEDVIANLGPSVGLIFNATDAVKLINEGQTQRAIETLVPAILAKPMTAYRLGTEGATNKKGVVMGGLYPEEFNAWELALEAMGFQTEERAMKGKAAFQAVEYQTKVQARHDEIMNRIWFDIKFGSDTLPDTLERAAEFSEKNPGKAITAQDILETVNARARSDAEAEAIGARLDKKLLYKTLPMLRD